MAIKGNAPWLGGIGVVVTVATALVIAWGRVRPVTVPLTAPPCQPLVACAAGGMSQALVVDAVGLLREHGVTVQVVPTCDAANVVVRVEPMLDDRASADDVEPRLREQTSRTWGAGNTCVAHADVAVLDGSSLTAVVHGLLHASGRDHPRAAPTGHVLDPDRPSLRDWRGIP